MLNIYSWRNKVPDPLLVYIPPRRRRQLTRQRPSTLTTRACFATGWRARLVQFPRIVINSSHREDKKMEFEYLARCLKYWSLSSEVRDWSFIPCLVFLVIFCWGGGEKLLCFQSFSRSRMKFLYIFLAEASASFRGLFQIFRNERQGHIKIFFWLFWQSLFSGLIAVTNVKIPPWRDRWACANDYVSGHNLKRVAIVRSTSSPVFPRIDDRCRQAVAEIWNGCSAIGLKQAWKKCWSSTWSLKVEFQVLERRWKCPWCVSDVRHYCLFCVY